MLQGGCDRFFDYWHGTLIPLALPNGSQIDAGENERQLGSAHFDRHSIAGDHGKLERTGFESFVPDRQAVTIPIEDLESVAASIHEQEQVAGGGILAKGRGHQAGERIKALAEIGGWSVEEHSDGMREADHREPPVSVLAPTTALTRRQARRAFAVGIRMRTPLGKSASMESSSVVVGSTTRTVTGRKADGAGNAGRRSARSMSRSRRFQA